MSVPDDFDVRCVKAVPFGVCYIMTSGPAHGPGVPHQGQTGRSGGLYLSKLIIYAVTSDKAISVGDFNIRIQTVKYSDIT